MAKPRSTKPAKVVEKQPARRDRLDKRWYTRKGPPHEAVMAVVEKLLHSSHRNDLKLWRDLYLDRMLEQTAAKRWSMNRPGLRARMNIIRNACETLLARVGKHQPRLMVATVAGDWSLQRRSKKLQRYIDGDWDRLKAAQIRREAIHDALVFGEGCIKVTPNEELCCVEWNLVWTGNILHHPREEAARCIRTEYEICFIDREILRERWPKHEKAIDDLGPVKRDILSFEGGDDEDDLALVVEAWHLPAGKDDEGHWVGGRHVICIDGATLLDEPWEQDYFPIEKIYATRDPLSTRGIGYPERMAGAQAEQNALSELASEVALKMTPKYVTMAGSGLETDVASNDIEFWQCNGTVPPFVLSAENNLMQLMAAAQMQRIEAYRIEGIAEDMAEGSSPANLDSGKAKLVHRDVQSERHVDLHQRVEDFTLGLGHRHIGALDELAADEESESPKVLAAGRKKKGLLEEMSYADVKLERDSFRLRCYPVSSLSNTPEGRLSQVQEMLAGQLIGPDEARELLDLPDTERANDEHFSLRDFARDLIEHALDGNITRPTEMCDLGYLVEHGRRQYALASMQGASEQQLVHLFRLIAGAQSILDKKLADAQAAASAAAPAGPLMPTAPATPPVQPTGPIGLVQ